MLRTARHLRDQLPVLRAMGRLGFVAARQRLKAGQRGQASVPGPLMRTVVPARERSLIDDYLRHVGGDPGAYAGVLPAHLFPQWTFPVQARAIEHLEYPVSRVLNAGCRVDSNLPLPDHESLEVTAQLTEIEDDGYKAILHQRVVTQTASAPEALVVHMQALVPLRRRSDPSSQPKHLVPEDAERVATVRLDKKVGLQFAMLTGDFNPVHWVGPYARMFGFRSTIVHGFATMARAMETLVHARFDDDPQRLAGFECRFTRPLVYPASVSVFVSGDQIFVGDDPLTKAYLTGSFTGRPRGGKGA